MIRPLLMKTLATSVTVVALCYLAPAVFGTPPANDDFADAAVLAGPSGSGTGTTVEATVEPGEPLHGGFPAVASIWYAWTAATNGFLTFSKQDQGGPDVGIYLGAVVNSLTEIHPATADPFNRFTFPVQQGVTYHISINGGGFGLAGGTIPYGWQFTLPPANDNFANAEPVSGESGSVSATTWVATVEPGEPNSQGGHTLWYSWIAPRNGTFFFESDEADSHVYTGTGLNALTEHVRLDRDEGIRVIAGTDYFIQIGRDPSAPNATGEFTLEWRPGPVNDDFANATVVAGDSGMIAGSNLGASLEPNEPPIIGLTGSKSIWYAWTAPETKWYTFAVSNGGFLFAAYRGASVDALVPVGESYQTITFHAESGTIYHMKTSADRPGYFDDNLTLTWRSGTSLADAALLNLSTRARVGVEAEVLIGGFIITGADPKKMIIRAIGPSMTSNGTPMPGRLADPILELRNSTGALLFSNDDWVNSPQRQEIIDSTIPPTDDKEAAIVATLPPASYTAIVRGSGNTTGIALMELYDLQVPSQSRLANVSTRGLVGVDANVLIGGFIIGGSLPTKVAIRGLGPSLANTNPPIEGVLANPQIAVRDSNGNLRGSVDDWRQYLPTELIANGLAPANDREAALIETLQPGAYTAIVSGVNGTTGVALVEIYNLN